jgi:TolA-binding protein
MLSTGELAQWQPYFLIAALFFSICACALSLYSARRLRTEYPSKTLLNAVRAEIDSLSGDIADLTNRFSRFQKREGMREAREAKRSNAELQAEAMQIVGQGASPEAGSHPKASLYAKLRNH